MTRWQACLILVLLAACGAKPVDAGPDYSADRRPIPGCEGCEAAAERDPATLTPTARLGAKGEEGEPLILRGVVRDPAGRAPAAGVVIYAYHTNPAGLYADGSGETQASRRHGRLRGWVRTGPDGRYQFTTVKPGVYPDRSGPAHIHLLIWRPGRPPDWVDSVVFRDEFGVTPAYVAGQERRGGSGVVQLRRTPDNVLLAERDITLPAPRS